MVMSHMRLVTYMVTSRMWSCHKCDTLQYDVTRPYVMSHMQRVSNVTRHIYGHVTYVVTSHTWSRHICGHVTFMIRPTYDVKHP